MEQGTDAIEVRVAFDGPASLAGELLLVMGRGASRRWWPAGLPTSLHIAAAVRRSAPHAPPSDHSA